MEPIRIRHTKLWQLAATAPIHKHIFMDAEILLAHAQAYFRWCEDNPRYKTEVVRHKMQWETIEIALKRPYTLSGLCMYLGVAQSYLRQTRSDLLEMLEAGRIDEPRVQVLAAIEWINQMVFTDQIEGAATGQYNANIVARLNGLADNVNNANLPDPVLRVVTRDAETTDNLNLLVSNL